MKKAGRGARLVICMEAGSGFGVLAHVDFATLELHKAIGFGENGVVLAQADIEAGLELGAALTHDDGAALGELTAIELDATVLRVGVATVLGGTLSFLMCHDAFPGSCGRSRL